MSAILLGDDVSPLFLLKEQQVTAHWSHSYDRNSNQELDSKSDELWEKRCRTNSRLYNATKFRLDTWHHKKDRLHLNLGLTCYKDYVCTNQAPHSLQYLEYGFKEHGNPHALMADPVAVGAYLEANDNKIVLLERSKWCAEAPGLIDRPGGHPEPKEFLESSNGTELESHSSESLVKEIFSSIQNEIRDEVNLDPKYLSAPLLLGIFRCSTTSGRPVLDFYVRCSLPSDAVVSLYRSGTQAEADESTNIFLVDTREFVSNMELLDMFNKFTPSLKASLPLFQGFLKAPK